MKQRAFCKPDNLLSVRLLKNPIGRLALFAVLSLLLCLGVLVVNAYTKRGAAEQPFTESETPRPAPDQITTLADSPKARSLRIWIHGDDLYPFFVRTRPGNFVIRAENETQSDVTLIIERVTSGQANQRLSSVSTVNRAKRVDQRVALGVGEYVFYEASRPQRQGKIIVEPN